MYQKKALKKNMLTLLLIGEKGKRHYVLIKDFNTFIYMIILYIVGENIFVDIVYKFLVQKKY